MHSNEQTPLIIVTCNSHIVNNQMIKIKLKKQLRTITCVQVSEICLIKLNIMSPRHSRYCVYMAIKRLMTIKHVFMKLSAYLYTCIQVKCNYTFILLIKIQLSNAKLSLLNFDDFITPELDNFHIIHWFRVLCNG